MLLSFLNFFRPTLDELRVKARYCQEILKIYRKLFPLWSYPTSIVEHEEMTVTISIVFKMKEEYYEKSEVDLVLAKLYDFCDKSIDMLNLEEDRYENLAYIKITNRICSKSCCSSWS